MSDMPLSSDGINDDQQFFEKHAEAFKVLGTLSPAEVRALILLFADGRFSFPDDSSKYVPLKLAGTTQRFDVEQWRSKFDSNKNEGHS